MPNGAGALLEAINEDTGYINNQQAEIGEAVYKNIENALGVSTNFGDTAYTQGKVAIVSDQFAATNPDFNNGMYIRASELGADYTTGKGGKLNPNATYAKLQETIGRFGASGAYIHSDEPLVQSRINFNGEEEIAHTQDFGLAMPTDDEIKNLADKGGNLPYWQLQ